MTNKLKIAQKLQLVVAATFLIVVALITSNFRLDAAGLSTTSVRFTRMAAATGTTFRVVFTVPAGNTGTEDKIRVGFPDAYTVATSGLTVASSSCGATNLPGGSLTVAGDNTGGQKSITVSGTGNLLATTSYCVEIGRTSTNDPITNPSAGIYSVSVETQTSGSAQIDNTVIGARVISNDQIVISAVVPPSFNFVLDANTTSFTTNLDSGSVVHTTPRTVTITTNASYGWTTWARDSNTGLTSAAAAKTIASTTPGTSATLIPNNEGYVLGVAATDAGGGGTVSVVAAYAGGGADANGSGLDTTYRQIASSNGTANGDVLTLRGKASINAFTPAGLDYTDTWTIIGAGSF